MKFIRQEEGANKQPPYMTIAIITSTLFGGAFLYRYLNKNGDAQSAEQSNSDSRLGKMLDIVTDIQFILGMSQVLLQGAFSLTEGYNQRSHVQRQQSLALSFKTADNAMTKADNSFKKSNYSIAERTYHQAFNILKEHYQESPSTSLRTSLETLQYKRAVALGHLYHNDPEKLAECYEILDDLITNDGSNIKALNLRGLLSFITGRYDRAVEDFEKSFEIQSNQNKIRIFLLVIKNRIVLPGLTVDVSFPEGLDEELTAQSQKKVFREILSLKELPKASSLFTPTLIEIFAYVAVELNKPSTAIGLYNVWMTLYKKDPSHDERKKVVTQTLSECYGMFINSAPIASSSAQASTNQSAMFAIKSFISDGRIETIDEAECARRQEKYAEASNRIVSISP